MVLTIAVLTLVVVMVAAEAPLSNTYGPPGRSAASPEIPSLSSRSALASQHGDPASVIIRYNGANGGSRSSGSSASRPRSNGYSAPAPAARSSSQSAPSNTYSAPSSSFNAPSNSYSAPSNSYSAPSTAYRAPPAPARSNNFAAAPSSSISARQSAPSSQFSAPSPRYGAPAPVYGVPSVSNSLQEDPLAEPANYEFTYEVQDLESGSEFSQQESRKDESAQGSYRVLLPDGVLQIVEYQADEEGFRPTITYEETNNIPSSKSSQGPYPASSNYPQGPY